VQIDAAELEVDGLLGVDTIDEIDDINAACRPASDGGTPDIDSREFAEQFGFGIVVSLNDDPVAVPDSPDLSELPDCDTQVLQLDDQLRAELASSYLLLQEEVDRHPDVIAARDGWSACLADAGIEASTQQDLENLVLAMVFGGEMTEDEVVDAEIELAVTSYDCADELRTIRDQVSGELAAQFGIENAELLEQLRRTASVGRSG